jgi:adenine-specific DNA-methyltransferase
LKIQAIRDKIEGWFKTGLIDKKEKIWLIACLLESADRAANTASVYGAYLKKIKKSAQKPVELIGIKSIGSDYKPGLHKVYCEDALSLLSGLKNKKILLTYIDPPYNHRQYSANYHILETIAKWDINSFTPRGVTGLRDSRELNSDFCIRSKAEKAFDRLFSLLTSKYVIMSYNNEGLMNEKQIRGLFKKYCLDFKFRKIEYQRYRADLDHEQRNYKADKTFEYLVIGRLKFNA